MFDGAWVWVLDVNADRVRRFRFEGIDEDHPIETVIEGTFNSMYVFAGEGGEPGQAYLGSPDGEIISIARDGAVSTFAGGGEGPVEDGDAASTGAISADDLTALTRSDGKVVVAFTDRIVNRVRYVDDGIVRDVTYTSLDGNDGSFEPTRLVSYARLTSAPGGRLYLLKQESNDWTAVHAWYPDFTLQDQWVGGDAYGDPDVDLTEVTSLSGATLDGPMDPVALPDGRLLLLDKWHRRILIIDPDQDTVTPLADLTTMGRDGYPDAMAAALGPDGPFAVLSWDGVIVHVAADGFVSGVGGLGGSGNGGDNGDMSQAQFSSLQGLAINELGELFVADSGNHRIRKVGTDGWVLPVVGGADSDGGMGILNWPTDVAIDPDGRLLIADTNNLTIRRWDPATAVMERILGGGDGPVRAEERDLRPGQVSLGYADTVDVSPAGAALTFTDLYSKSTGFMLLAGESIDDKNPRAWWIAGTPRQGRFDGDGDFDRVEFAAPHGAAVTADGDVWVADFLNDRVVRLPDVFDDVSKVGVRVNILPTWARPSSVSPLSPSDNLESTSTGETTRGNTSQTPTGPTPGTRPA